MEEMEIKEPNPILKKMKNEFLASQSVVTAQDDKANKDRFDDLPDSLIQHILSFMKTKDAIRTSVLAKRWRCLWVSTPCLNFNSTSFTQLIDFKKFVLWVLSRRDSSKIKVLIYSRFGEIATTDQDLLYKVIRFVVSRGLLKLPSFETLTTLYLSRFNLRFIGVDCQDPFANFINLKTLNLSEMTFIPDMNSMYLVISLLNFTCKIVIVAPQLTNFKYLYSSPSAFIEFSHPSLDGLTIHILEHYERIGRRHPRMMKGRKRLMS
ncbi:hypothetical protein RIF29_24714 [Crotalaria pallida]|uniref:F-box domain-containing protein n=1 Tax=Crotalaria pallida TaxID=3830 RepID=A0AAN9EL14_CROPI